MAVKSQMTRFGMNGKIYKTVQFFFNDSSV